MQTNITPAIYTPDEKRHNCEACTLASAMRTCGKGCAFYTVPAQNGINFKNIPLLRRVAIGNRYARELRKTRQNTGEIAAKFWELTSNSHALPVDVAGKLYTKAGFYAFQGYPLRSLPNKGQNS